MARGDLYRVDFPPSDGHEQTGMRPAIVIIANEATVHNPMSIVIPITSQIKTTRFPFTLKIEPSQQNGLTKESVALIYQLRAIGNIRLVNKLGRLEEKYQTEIDKLIRKLLGV